MLLLLSLLLACRDEVVTEPPLPTPTPVTTADVDPFIATGGPGFRVGSSTPAASLPFGLVKLGPDTSMNGTAPGFYHCSGYHWDDTHIEGFSHLHLVGTGVADYGQVLVMPTDGWSPEKTSPDGWRRAFSHDDERASPGWYSVTLADGIRVELSATRHTGHHRYTFPDSVGAPTVVLDLGHVLNGESLGGHVEVDPAAGVIRGYARTRGGFTSDLRVYVYAVVDGGFDSFGTWDDTSGDVSRVSADGTVVGAWFAPRSREVSLRVGISLTSVEEAEANLRAELDAPQDVKSTAADADDAWNDALARLNLAGGSDDQRVIAASALYRALLMPQEHGDADGTYVGFDGVTHAADGWVYHSDMSLWDTYRTAHPMYALLYPEAARDFSLSLLAMAEQGGAFPRWPAALGDGGSMIGAPADIVLADAYLRGVTDVRMEDAWPRLRAQALGQVDAGYNGRTGTAEIDALGYIPSDVHGGSVAWQQELNWADGAMANLARSLGEDEDAAFFAARARTFVNNWDPAVGFFHGRRSDGTFEPTLDPLAWEEEYVEGNAWQYLWMPFPEWATLRETLGGAEAARGRLTTFFEEARREGVLDFPQTYYWHGNEPDIHTPWLFSLWGDADAAWRWIRWIDATHYASAPVGLAGNDDGGTLSAWYLFAGMGLYPIAGTDSYVVSPPLFEAVAFPVEEGIFTTRRVGMGDHVVSATLDGRVLASPIVHQDELRAGGELVVTLGD